MPKVRGRQGNVLVRKEKVLPIKEYVVDEQGFVISKVRTPKRRVPCKSKSEWRVPRRSKRERSYACCLTCRVTLRADRLLKHLRRVHQLEVAGPGDVDEGARG